MSKRRSITAGEKRGCEHKIARHEHGTRQAYVLDRCRCRPCADAASAYERARQRRNAYGRANLVDAAPVRQHLEALQEAGIGRRRVAEQSGVSKTVIEAIVHGKRTSEPQRRVRRETAAAILAVPVPEPVAQLVRPATLQRLGGRTRVDGTGTRRRLRALVALGWSMAKLGQEAGLSRATMSRVILVDDVPVEAATARAVLDVYDRLWAAAPPEREHREKISAARARRYAAERGWVLPMAWDDDQIDDPAATPCEPAAAPRARGERVSKVDIDEVVWLLDGGASPLEVASRLGVTPGTLEDTVRRLGREDVLVRVRVGRKGRAAA